MLRKYMCDAVAHGAGADNGDAKAPGVSHNAPSVSHAVEIFPHPRGGRLVALRYRNVGNKSKKMKF